MLPNGYSNFDKTFCVSQSEFVDDFSKIKKCNNHIGVTRNLTNN